MTLTLTQIKHRADDIAGEIKAATSVAEECYRDWCDKQRLAEIANAAHQHACIRLEELRAERETLATHAAELIRLKGEPPPYAEEDPAHNVVIEVVSDGRSLLEMVEANANRPVSDQAINSAFDRATHPQGTNGKAQF